MITMKSSDLNESIFCRTVRRIFTLIAEYGWNFLHSLLTCVMFPIFLNNFHWWIPSTKLKGWVKELITLMKYNKVSWTTQVCLESLSDRRVGACKRFMAIARQMSPLKNIIPSPAAFESHYSMRVQLPRRQHGHTRRINDFVTYKFQWMYVNG